jgi:hypothetical protein
MLFVGGRGSITHMHFDIDLSHIFHTQFGGKKRVLLFPFEEAAQTLPQALGSIELCQF